MATERKSKKWKHNHFVWDQQEVDIRLSSLREGISDLGKNVKDIGKNCYLSWVTRIQIYWVLTETVSGITVSLVRVTNFRHRSSDTLTQVVTFFKPALSCGFTCIFWSHKASTGSQSVTIWANTVKRTKTNRVRIKSVCSKMCITITFKLWINDRLAFAI